MFIIDSLIEQFKELHSPYDLAALFNTTKSRLFFNLYKLPEARKYKTFSIPKKGGDKRDISAPIGAIRHYQTTLCLILSHYYLMTSKSSSHGFVYGKSIVTNSKRHLRSSFVLNLDLENFFPAINFGRVRGLFLSFPFYFNPKIATLLAQICTFNNQLPQGAPTSPIISNFICSRLDAEISRFASRNKCTYSRYADDITISTFLRNFPPKIAKFENINGKKLIIGSDFEIIIIDNGFQINSEKSRLANYSQHQEVTGLTVNRKLNVSRKMLRSIKSMLHAWEKYNYESAELEHFKKYSKKSYSPEYQRPSFKKILKGKIDFIGMVRGPTDKIYYQRYIKRYKDLTLKSSIALAKGIKEDFILIGEGKTDVIHLKAALRALQSEEIVRHLKIYIQEAQDSNNINDSELLKCCRAWSNSSNEKVIICMFDSDVPATIKKATDKNSQFKHWGNKVYSFVLPTPDHRQNDPELCIELYYSDQEIKTVDENGHRLYLNSEFDHKTLCHKENKSMHCTDRQKVMRKKLTIIDDGVFMGGDNNLALSKNHFARNISVGTENFSSFDFTQFLKIFKIVDEINAHASSQAGS